MRTKRLGIMTTLAAGGLFAFAGAAEADSINNAINIEGSQGNLATLNTAFDTSGEYISNGGTTVNDYKVDRTLAVDSVIRGAFQIDTINGVSIGGTEVLNEWTGVFAIRVDSLVEDLTADSDGVADGDPTEQDWTVTFAPDANFDDWLNAISPGAGAGMPGGTMIRMFEDEAFRDFDVTASDGDANEEDADAHVATALNGALYWDLGFGTRGSDWLVTESALLAPPDFAGSLSGADGEFELTLLASGAGAVDLIEAGVASIFAGGPDFVDFTGNTEIFGGGANDAVSPIATAETAGFHARNSATLEFQAIPIPAAAGPGIVLLGLLGFARKRRQA